MLGLHYLHDLIIIFEIFNLYDIHILYIFVPASAWVTIKCACQNVMSKTPYSQPYTENIFILKPQSCYLAYLKLNIQNKGSYVAYFLLIAGNVPDRSVF